MIDFQFVAPTKIIFGHKAEEKVGQVATEFGFHHALIVYGSARIEKDLLPQTERLLQESGIASTRFGGVRPNPLASKVREGVALAREVGADFVLAIGGGSPIDTAKSIAVGFYYDGDPFDFNLKKASPTKALPIGVILTHASAGSEGSNSCVIQDDEIPFKGGINSDLVRPAFAIEDPELTYGVSAYQTAAGQATS